MNSKCLSFYLSKVDFEHSDPLSKVLGPAGPDYRWSTGFLPMSLGQANSTHWMSDTPSIGSWESWVLVTRLNDFVLQL